MLSQAELIAQIEQKPALVFDHPAIGRDDAFAAGALGVLEQ